MLDRMWGEFGLSLSPKTTRVLPYLDLAETGEELVLKVEIPGVDPEDLDIHVNEDSIVIRGESKQDMLNNTESFHRTERRYGSFSRTLRLPCRVMVEDVTAVYKKGILEIMLPKCKAQKSKRVKIVYK
jgi:HSP20 family protein